MIAYDTCTQASLAVLCTFLRPRWVAFAGAGIFTSQAFDELLEGNLFGAGLWEYPLSALYVTAVFLILRSHDSERGQ